MAGKMTHKKSGNLLRQVIPGDFRSFTELHVHLGGSVPIYRLWEMGMARGIRGVADSYEDFIKLLHRSSETSSSLDEYLEIFDIVELIQAGPEAVQESIRIAINGAYRTGGMTKLGPGGEGGDPNPLFSINQLELRFNPMKRTGVLFTKEGAHGLFDVDRIIRSACESAEESELAYRGAIKTGLIFCFGRDMTWEANKTLAEKIRYWKKTQKKLIGIDLAGPESAMSLKNPKDLELMAEIYEIAAGNDLGRTVHAGETKYVDIDTFLATVHALKPHRVAHPIVAALAYWENNDARGLELLAEKNICCELCIKSNLLTKALESAEQYKRFLQTLDQFEISYTFSTDSPALQLTTLANELEFLLEQNAISAEQIIKALQTAEKNTFIK
jgi:adenosine deaminase